MGTKEVMVVVPPLVLLHDRTFQSGSFATALRRHTALYSGLAATWLVPFGLIGTDTLLGGEFARPELPTPGALEYGLTQPRILLHYLRLAFWPSPLCFDYQWPPATTAAEILPSAMLVTAALAATLYWVWRGSWLGFAASWFFLILAPTSSFLPIQDLAVEHRMYLPLAAVATTVVILGYHALAPMGARRSWLGALGVGGVAIALGIATADRNRDYRDEIALWSSVVEAAPGNARAYYNLATRLREQGELDPAIAAYRRSLELAPEQPRTHYNLANALKQAGDLDAAIDHYRRNLALLPEHAAAHVNLANVFFSRGEYEQAIRHYRLAVAADAGYPGAHYNLGVVLEREGRIDAAIVAYREALRLRPRSAATHNNLGNALLAQGQLNEAIRHYQRAIAFDHDHVRARHNLGVALEAAGEPGQAAEAYRMALKIDPDYASARQRLDALASEDTP
jgi:tetratricopeptide (TPR) repeat protein